jgi:group I intron endonuclease
MAKINPGIYKITNTINNRIYIGSSNNINKRKSAHFYSLKNNKHPNQFLQNDYNKCGEESFVFEVILETDCEDLLLDFEQSYLDEYWDNCINCYNIAKCAEAFARGLKLSEETKNKMSEASKGKPKSEEHKKKISNLHKGKKHSEETKLKMSDIRKGKKHSEETKLKMSDTRKGKKLSKSREVFLGELLKELDKKELEDAT